VDRQLLVGGVGDDQPQVSGAEEASDAEDQVVEVAAVGAEVVEGPDAAADEVSDGPRRDGPEVEAKRRQKETLAPGVLEAVEVVVADALRP